MYFVGQVPLYTTKKVHIESISTCEQISIQLINTYYHFSGLNLLLPLEKDWLKNIHLLLCLF